MPEIVTDKLTLRHRNLRAMIEIELPCCGTTGHLEDLGDEVDCEACGVVLELGDSTPQALPVAA